MDYLMAVILAAGEGKRMKSKNHKAVNKICGRALIEWVYGASTNAGIAENIVVVGHRQDQIRDCMGEKVKYVVQEKQLGTGHALMQAARYLKGKKGCAFVLYGDTPLITSKTISETIRYHKENKCSATVITAEFNNPSGYGRIIRNSKGDVVKIIEHKDASQEELLITEVNSGMYCFEIESLIEALDRIDNNNNQGEYYLTDTLGILADMGLKVGAVKVDDPDEVLGINDRIQLHQASEIIRKRILNKHMTQGVTIIDPFTTYIDEDIEIGIDTIIYPGTILEGTTSIGEDCIIGPNARLISSNIGNCVEIVNSVVLGSSVGDCTKVGPFAYIRPESDIGKGVKIGDFVEIKKSVIGDKTKISHLTYIGDAEVGINANIGCGVVTVNYDGKNKNKTVIGSNSFVGCNVNLIAPVEVKANSYIAAGSTITDEVPENSLAIARERQVIKEGWVIKKGMLRE